MTSQTSTELWTHPDKASTQVDSFRRYVNRTFSRNIKTYEELLDWSVTDIKGFAHAVWVFCGVIHSRPYSEVGRGLDKMWPPPQWFPDTLLNYAENILGPGLATKPDAIAVTSMREGPTVVRELTFAELERKVLLYGGALKRLGVGKGDRIGSKHFISSINTTITDSSFLRR
jgi:acetoacetyl-CoA synthetase